MTWNRQSWEELLTLETICDSLLTSPSTRDSEKLQSSLRIKVQATPTYHPLSIYWIIEPNGSNQIQVFYFLSVYLLLSVSPILLTCWPLTWASWWRISGLMIPKSSKKYKHSLIDSTIYGSITTLQSSVLGKNRNICWNLCHDRGSTALFVQKASMFLSAGREIILSMQLVDKERCLPTFQAISLEVWETYGMILCSSSHNHFGGCNRKCPIGRIQFPLNGTTAGWGRVNDVWLWPSIPGYLL